MPPVAINRMGQVSDFAMLEAASPILFRTDRSIGERQSRSIPANHRGIKGAWRASRDGDVAMHPFHQRTFYSLPRGADIETMCVRWSNRLARFYLNASDWIERPDEFADHLHLSASGADDFSRRLADYLRDSNAANSAAPAAPLTIDPREIELCGSLETPSDLHRQPRGIVESPTCLDRRPD